MNLISSKPRRHRLWTALVLCVLSQSGTLSAADSPLNQKASRYRKTVAGQGIQAGCAKIEIAAPINTVIQVMNDFDHYSSFMRRYKDGRIQLQIHAKVISRNGDKPEVYLEVPILKGAAKVWGVLRFEPPKKVEGEDVREGHLVRGNVERLDARWRIQKIDERRTTLSAELLIVPKVPVPHDLVTGELEFVSDVVVTGARDEAERRASRP